MTLGETKNSIVQEVERCIRCGNCQRYCPAYQEELREAACARGRLAQIRSVLEGTLPTTKDLVDNLKRCLRCGACVRYCPAGIAIDQTVAKARRFLVQRLSWGQVLRFVRGQCERRYALRTIVACRNKLAEHLRLASSSRLGASGLRGLLQRFGAHRPVPLSVDDHLPELPEWFFHEMRSEEGAEQKRKTRIGYFVGCGVNFFLPETGLATTKLLQRAGYDVEILRNECCGMPAFVQGNKEVAKRMARANLSVLEQCGAETIITDCAACSWFLKSYPQLFDNDTEMHERAKTIAKRVRDIGEVASGLRIEPSETHKTIRATYHDPCRLARDQEIREQPRQFLRHLSGIDFVEMRDAGLCCGGSSYYGATKSRAARTALEAKMRNIEETGAEVVFTACPSCIRQLSGALAEAGSPIRVAHISEAPELLKTWLLCAKD